jgi:hypothetical protein
MMAAAFSPDGRRVAAGCYDHTVWVGEVDAGGALRELPDGHRGHVISLRFSPDSRRLLSGSYDRQAILWDVQAGRLERVFPTPVETRWSAFRADGRRLLTLGSGTEQGRGRVIEWDTATRQPVRVIRETVRAAWFVGDDVVVSADNELRLYRQTEQDAGQATDPTVLARPLPAGSGDRLFLAPGGWQMWVPGIRAKPAADDAPSDRPESPVLRSPAGETLPLPLPLRAADSVEFVDISSDGTRLLTSFESVAPQGPAAAGALGPDGSGTRAFLPRHDGPLPSRRPARAGRQRKVAATAPHCRRSAAASLRDRPRGVRIGPLRRRRPAVADRLGRLVRRQPGAGLAVGRRVGRSASQLLPR